LSVGKNIECAGLFASGLAPTMDSRAVFLNKTRTILKYVTRFIALPKAN
jgi:hypothetical protein